MPSYRNFIFPHMLRSVNGSIPSISSRAPAEPMERHPNEAGRPSTQWHQVQRRWVPVTNVIHSTISSEIATGRKLSGWVNRYDLSCKIQTHHTTQVKPFFAKLKKQFLNGIITKKTSMNLRIPLQCNMALGSPNGKQTMRPGRRIGRCQILLRSSRTVRNSSHISICAKLEFISDNTSFGALADGQGRGQFTGDGSGTHSY